MRWNELSMKDRADVMKLFIDRGIYDLDTIKGEYNRFAEGGGIHIDPSKRGTFTAAASRHNMGVQEFASKVLANKDDYSAAMVKKANFARNASKWHAYGGNLFDGGGYVREKDNNPVAFDEEGNLVDQVTGEKGYLLLPQLSVTANPDDVARGRAQRWYRDFGIESNDATSVADGRRQNSHLDERGIEGAAKAAAWMKDNPTLNNVGMALGATPFALAGYPAFMAAGEGAATALANPYVDAALTSYFGAHGLQSLANGEANWMTALELAPLGRLAKPMFNEAALAVENYRYPLGRPQVPEDYLTVKPQVRTRVGDVEIDNPNLLYHLDRGDSAGAFSNQGAYVEDGILFPGVAKKEGQLGYSWWNEGKPYATSVNGQPMTRLMTAAKDTPGMLQVRSQSYPIGQWTGSKGFVLPSEYVSSEGINVSGSTYALDPNYGWRRVFAEDTPTIEWANALKTPQITAENATSITPAQWTAAQDAAIARGDMAEAQRLRDLHFKVSAPDTKVVDINRNPQLVIHKTPNDFTVSDNSRSIGNLNWAATQKAFEGENGVYATGAGANPKEMRLYINMKNPHYPTIDEGMEPAFINEGEDGILGIADKDMTDFYKSASDAGEGFNMSLGVDNPYALKSADAVTYDNNGVRIPLGDRDNFNINDIRYGLLPFGIGLTGYGIFGRDR